MNPEEADAPPRRMDDWRVFETPAGERHAVGCTYEAGGYIRDGRITSPIKLWDASTATLTTRSSRRYTLYRRPGLVLDGEYVFNAWCARNGITDQTRDVSEEIWSQMVEAGAVDERGMPHKKG